MDKPLPVLILDKNDFSMSISIHQKIWRCIDISPVRGMPKEVLVVRSTYQNNNKFTIVAYKVHDLYRNTGHSVHVFDILRKLLKSEFENVGKLYPINFIVSYDKLIGKSSMETMPESNAPIEVDLDGKITLLLPSFASKGENYFDGKMDKLTAVLSEHDSAYVEWKAYNCPE